MGCGGVMVLDGTRHCYIEERSVHPSGRPFNDRELMTSLDHYIPRAMGTDGRMHEVHHYCQLVQGGLIGGPRRAEAMTPEQQSANGRVAGRLSRGGLLGGKVANDATHQADPSYHDAKRRGGLAVSFETHARGGATAHDAEHRARPSYTESRRRGGRTLGATGIGNCVRWNVRRGKPCTCGHHV